MTIIANHYRIEQSALENDAIIQAMAKSLPADYDVNQSDFMMTCYREYLRRGGQHCQTIGGPHRAIVALRS